MRDYFRYYLPDPASGLWGVFASGVGFTRIRPGSRYPPEVHPHAHHFSWESGRVLDEYQLVYISHGGGFFESKESGPQAIAAGTLFMIFPGVWHRYRPDPASGWVEHWIELQGEVMQRFRRARLIDPQKPCVVAQPHSEIHSLFEQCHYLAQATPPAYSSLLAVTGLQIVARALSLSEASNRHENRTDEAVRKAQAVLAEAAMRSVSLEALAAELGLSYSSFRRLFKAQTGHSPKQYHLRLRLGRVKELLRGSDKTIAEIADLLGFDSPYHLSSQFKRFTSLSPKNWRQKTVEGKLGG